MRIPFIGPRQRDYSILPLAPKHSRALPVLHHEDFVRPWGEDEFSSLLSQDTVFGFAASAARLGKAVDGSRLAPASRPACGIPVP